MNESAMKLTKQFIGLFPDLSKQILERLVEARSSGLGSKESLDSISCEMAMIIEQDIEFLSADEIVEWAIGSSEKSKDFRRGMTQFYGKMYEDLLRAA